MMQSILLATPNKDPASELNSETKVASGKESVDANSEEGKASSRFAKVLEEVSEGDSETVNNGSSVKVGELETSDLDELLLEAETVTEEEILVENSSDELAVDEVPVDDTSNYINESIELSNADKESVDERLELSNTDEEPFDEYIKFNPAEEEFLQEKPLTADLGIKGKGQVVEVKGDLIEEPAIVKGEEKLEATSDKISKEAPDEQVQDKFVSPILAQIEAAQQTDTKVKETKPLLVTQEVGSILGDPKKSGKEKADPLQKMDKLSFENVLADDESGDQNMELLSKANVTSSEKFNSMLNVINPEVSKATVNQSMESNLFYSIGSVNTSVDKLLNQTTNSNLIPALQSNTLQQPLDLQAKHASGMIGERVLMMLGQGKQEVTIRLDPAELGSMHIKLQVQQDQLQVAIQTQVGQSRDIIEQYLPRLREQLAQQGINLGETSVEQQSQQNSSNPHKSQEAAGTGQRGNGTDETLLEDQSEWLATQIPLPAQGIDYYA
ncbi:MAG: hypothetical protein GY787_03560 [Alteromonadales bacterium]|nr:hypothetical protein [Alteromonadales bacterium]